MNGTCFTTGSHAQALFFLLQPGIVGLGQPEAAQDHSATIGWEKGSRLLAFMLSKDTASVGRSDR